jgi:hypothetical protein
MVLYSLSSERDPLSVELIALCAVGKALASLEDPEARLRVLRWANERFQPASTAPAQAAAPAEEPAPAPPPALRLAPEPDAAVDGLDDLFEEPVNRPPTEIAADSCGVPGDAEDLSDLYELPSEPSRPPLHLVTREELPFDQLVDDFVDSFRRLTRESQRLT